MAVAVAWHLWAVLVVPANYDVLSYHLPLAWNYQAALTGEWRMFYADTPLGAPALQRLVSWRSGGGVGAAMVPAIAMLGGASCVASLALRCGARRKGSALAAALYLWHPMATGASLQHLTDPLVALYALAGAELLVASRSQAPGRSRWLAGLGGFVLASAATVKLSAVAITLLPLAGALLIARLISGDARRDLARAAGFAALGGAIAMAPWMIRAAWFLDAPFPWLVAWTAEQRALVVEAHGPQTPLEPSYWASVLARLGDFGFAFSAGPTRVSAAAAGALALMVLRRRSPAAALAAAGLAGVFAHALLAGQPARFLLPNVGLACAAVGVLAGSLRPARWRGPALALICAAVAWQVVVGSLTLLQARPAITREGRIAALAGFLGGPLIEAYLAAESLPKDAKLLVLFDARGALLPRSAAYTTVWDRWDWLAEGSTTARSAFASGYTHVLVNEFEWNRLVMFYGLDRHPVVAGDSASVRNRYAEQWLRAYPPAGGADADAVLRFLRHARLGATFQSGGGPRGSEIWLAPLPVPGSLEPQSFEALLFPPWNL
ncbi:MAG: hypothetical protein SF028_03495 [Candidatus Sumerlaeia bacterium]|nr:hypothetical protein [Candidatus Sumerlaeia bacterium]